MNFLPANLLVILAYANLLAVEAQTCGKGNPFRVLGEQISSTVDVPWVAKILITLDSGQEYTCSGALVECDLVLTEAACLQGDEGEVFKSGEVHLGNGLVRQNVTEIFMHPRFNMSDFSYDFALVRIGSKVSYDEFIYPVCLPNEEMCKMGVTDQSVDSCYDGTVVGFNANGILWAAAYFPISTRQCSDAMASASHFCATHQIQTASPEISGDGGATFVCRFDGYYHLVGHQSYYANEVDSVGSPSMFARVCAAMTWINQNINEPGSFTKIR